MKTITQLILILLLTFTVVPVYGVKKRGNWDTEYYTGIWACVMKEAISYKKNGEIERLVPDKFILKIKGIKENTLSIPDVLFFQEVKIVKRTSSRVIAYNEYGLFNFNPETKEFAQVGVANPDSIFGYFGNCEKFDNPE
ncbi:MAG: hypothetical protein HN472_08615 [Nitrospina sp.]|jgi:hypothetical protein|nr:hypothetical protein [Nitrospina sp.]MBT4047193.1 hypothetical protein [Nitrospina sp.]MBT4556188.1 hypothetical protein [Nitrospina sp.]MBT6248364.1 hypothetical protein [Nitrospina sp.]MBT6741115.1 hypothetical protein [Nitrospina sp.]